MENIYKIGQAVKMLKGKVTHHQLRLLCELGEGSGHPLIPGAFRTPAGHWRLPESAIQKIDRDGPPPTPAGAGSSPMAGTPPNPAQSPQRSRLLADPSEELISADEDVAITERQLKKRSLELQREEVEDKFRERAGKEEREEAEREAAQAAEDAEYEQRRLLEAWCMAGLGELPDDFPEDRQVDVVKALRTTLKESDDLTNDALIQKVVNSVVKGFVGRWEREKERWEREKEIARTIESSIPWEFRYDRSLKLEAQTAADREVKESGAESDSAIEAAVERACRPLLQRVEHRNNIKHVLDRTVLPHGSTKSEDQDARDSVEEALYAIEPGSSLRKYEAARDRAIVPHVEALKARQAREEDERKARQEREALERKKQEQERAAQTDRALRDRLLDENSWSLSGLPATEKKEAVVEVREAIKPLPLGTPERQVRDVADPILERYKAKHRLIESMDSAFVGSFGQFIEKLNGKLEFDAPLSVVKRDVWASVGPQLYEELDGTETQEEADKIMRQLVREELGLR